MGVTIRCKATGNSIDLGSGGFMRLRRRISVLVGDPWAAHYRTLTDTSMALQDHDWFKKFDAETERLVKARAVRTKTAFFLLQPDEGGYLPPGGCRQLLETIGDYDDDFIYGYAGLPHAARFRDFKRILAECAEHGCRLTWS